MKVIEDNYVAFLFKHPSARNILGNWFRPFQWDTQKTREENLLNALKIIMITGQQDEFINRLNMPHHIITSHGDVNLDHIANVGTMHLIDPALQYIEDNDLITEAFRRYNTNRNLERTLIYCNQDDKICHCALDYPSDYNYCGQVIYKDLLGVICVGYGDRHKYACTKDDIASAIARPFGVRLINMNTL